MVHHVVLSVRMCEGEGKEMIVNTNGTSTTFGYTLTDTGNLIEKWFTLISYAIKFITRVHVAWYQFR